MKQPQICVGCGIEFITKSRGKQGKNAKYHSLQCYQQSHGDYTDPVERFWGYVDKSGECWLWTGATTKEGYPAYRFRGRTVYARRFAFELTARLKPGLRLWHRRPDCRLCVRPDHMLAGSISELNAYKRQHA